MKTKGIFMAMLITSAGGGGTTEWVNPDHYPFRGHFLDLPQGRMHYVDEGEGEVLLFVHGTPTWSFLYREYIRHFSKTHRCIAMDHLGFGLSDKPADLKGTPQDHSANLVALIEKLDLTGITLVVHDFGGPIGLSAAIEKPERIKRIISFNTWLWETAGDKEVQKIDRLVAGRLGKFLYINLNISPRFLLKSAFADKRNLTREAHRHYLEPFRDKKSRNGLLQLARSLKGSSHWYALQYNRLDTLQNKPWLILWGSQDRFIHTGYLDKWKATLPDAEIREFACGHFVQEEATEASILAIEQFLREH